MGPTITIAWGDNGIVTVMEYFNFEQLYFKTNQKKQILKPE